MLPTPWRTLSINMFLTYGKKIDPRVVQVIYERYEGTTWYVQMVMNELFAITPKGAECVMEMIPIALDNVIAQQSCNYREIISMMATKKKMALLAIAKEGKAHNVTSSVFIKKYGLVSASSVQSAIIALLQDDFITQTNGIYRVYDYFFAEWLAQQ